MQQSELPLGVAHPASVGAQVELSYGLVLVGPAQVDGRRQCPPSGAQASDLRRYG
jgi:hypothetical protein